jgi:DNA topoisomerase-1
VYLTLPVISKILLYDNLSQCRVQKNEVIWRHICNQKCTMNLVIVESPAKCSKIQSYLGDGYKVIATMGHIRALEETLDAVGIDRDFEPMYKFIESKAKALKQLKDSAKDASKIYLASDDDREGEAISYSICMFLKLDPRKTPRIVFHEITEKAIKHAVNHPRLVDMNRVHAQQARSMLDMMIGFTMSPLLWKHVAMGLSAGRCQTPALRLVVEKEETIKNFSYATSWKLRGQWKSGSFGFSASMNDDLEDEESASNYLEMLQDPVTGKIISNVVKPWTLGAPVPLITSTLQQQASALFSIPPKSCMASAQRLYEGGHITYMRTDKAVLSEDAQNAIREFVIEKYGTDYAKEVIKGEIRDGVEDEEKEDEEKEDDKKKKKKTVKKTKKKGKDGDGDGDGAKAQEAHEAIRPTHIDVMSLPEGDWSASDKKIYGLIWQRAVQSMMTSAKGENCNINFTADACEDFPWTASWKRTTFPGWQIIGRIADIDAEGGGVDNSDDDSGDSEWKKAISIKVGSEITWTQLVAEPHESRAPTRYTEATLVRELEKHGIGRPSTFASLITTIQDKGYVECKNIPGRDVEIKTYTVNLGIWPPTITKKKKTVGAEKQKLVPTDLGRTSLRFMLEHFDDLFNYSFTGKMEGRLDNIAEGNEPWKEILRDMWKSYKERYEELKKGGGSGGGGGGGSGAGGKIIEFGDGYKAVLSKKGPLILFEPDSKDEKVIFYGWPEGIAFQDITKEKAFEFIQKKKSTEEGVGEWRGHTIIKKTGKFGPYAQAGEIIVSIHNTDTIEQIIEKLDKKADIKKEDKGPLKTFKEFEIHNGPYGPYIIKTKLKQRKFVSLPKTVTIDTLTEADVEALYKAGLEKKSMASKFKKK